MCRKQSSICAAAGQSQAGRRPCGWRPKHRDRRGAQGEAGLWVASIAVSALKAPAKSTNSSRGISLGTWLHGRVHPLPVGGGVPGRGCRRR
jgi:hypothetical protein